jgi:hypothetical protein
VRLHPLRGALLVGSPSVSPAHDVSLASPYDPFENRPG